MQRKVEIDCPNCAEAIEYFTKSRNFEGNIKCPKCSKLFFVKIENFEVIDVKTLDIQV